ncbi:MAG: penicillin acylase family protein [Ectothiorhodospiraceae bacterium]|nr:penicillin acylase family protein [Ectothiorhodospiraceae bacterium]
MSDRVTSLDPSSALPRRTGRVRVASAHGAITIRRDAHGVAHVDASDEHDAWLGQGYAAAQDRLWQMDFDRRRAVGRLAEVTGARARFGGEDAIAADVLARRLRLEAASRADVAAMSAETRAMFDAYAAGVNAFIAGGDPLPVEFTLCDYRPEPWAAWHSVVVFKIRHVLMGLWQQKVAWAHFLSKVDPERAALLPDTGSPPGTATILPPGAAVASVLDTAAADIAAVAGSLGFLAEVDGGSNSWVVSGTRVTTGHPVLCNDSHRALDVPNAYWQIHVRCPGFDVIGATFAGVPGFPHFGHNGSVAWNITHTQADYQDLFVERFDTDAPGRYRSGDGWKQADRREERIAVRAADDVVVETWATDHGPVVHGDPRQGHALALRYTATDRACRQWECLRPMLAARTVAALHETQREWVDPVNNLVSADTAGHIGYLCRGRLPIRASSAGRRVPAPGWDGAHEWLGDVPFERMPQVIDPPQGYIGTANQRVIDADEPYVSDLYASPHRADRIRELLDGTGTLSPETIVAMQGDRVSLVARAVGALLARLDPCAGDAERARRMLAGWDGEQLGDDPRPLLFACLRRELMRAVLEGTVGPDACAWLNAQPAPAYGRLMNHWMSGLVAGLDARYRDHAPGGRAWSAVLPAVLEAAWQAACAVGGDDPQTWRWDHHHRTAARHPLSFAFPEHAALLDPPAVGVGGDGDTLQAAGYVWKPGGALGLTLLSVYRQVVDFADAEHGSFVVPGGVSGLPGTAHYADQLEHWRTHRRVPMHRRADEVEAAAVTTLTLHG